MAQINSLQGVTNQAGQAQLARLQAQLKDAQDDMDDTMYQHQIEVRQSGYDQLTEDANEILNDTLKSIDANQAKRMEIVQGQLDLLYEHGVDSSSAIEKIISSTGVKLDSATDELLTNFKDGVTGKNGLSTENTFLKEWKDAATNTQWATGISDAINNLTTSQITTTTAKVKEAEDAITNEIAGIKTGQNSVDTKLGSITTALQNLQTSFTEMNAKIEKQQNNGYNASQDNKPADATQGGQPQKQENAVQQNTGSNPSGTQSTPAPVGAGGVSDTEWKTLKSQLKAIGTDMTFNFDDSNRSVTMSNDDSPRNEYGVLGTYKDIGEIRNMIARGYVIKPGNAKVENIVKKGKDVGSNKKEAYRKKNLTKSGYNAVRNRLIVKYGYDIGDKDNNDKYQKIGALFGVKLNKTPTADQLKLLNAVMNAAGYRKGAKSTDDELNWLHDSEIIVRKSDGAILQPFNSGDMVFTSKQSERLWKLSQIPLDTVKQMVANPDMSKFVQPGITDKMINNNTTENNNATYHFDSLITINGNADQNTVNSLEQIANALMNSRDFKKNMSNYVTKEMTREAAKSGFRGR